MVLSERASLIANVSSTLAQQFSTSSLLRQDRVGTRNFSEGADATKNAAERGVDATKDAARDATKAGGEKAGEVITDASITTAVKTKLLVDSKTPGLAIDVDTKDGVVTLNGTVPTKAAEDKTVADARGTKGVKRVVNNLRVAS